MQDYIIMTDSCCDLTDQMARELELEVLPLTMTMDGKEYPNTLDGRYITNVEFYKRLRAGKTSTTAAVNVGQFEDAMRTVLGRGQDILCLCFSSALSTTYQSAVIAAENVAPDFPEHTIRVIDTLSASRGQGLLVYLAAQKKKEGLTLSQLGDWVEDNKLHVCHWFTVDDLNFLKRGGRVSAATAMVGTMLSIKPVMHTDNEGRLTMVGKARGRKASLKALLDAIERLAIEPEKQTMFICHADCEEEAKQVAAEIQRRFGTTDNRIHYIGPVNGSHTGPNTMGLFFVGTERKGMKWLELKLDTSPAGLDPVSQLLEEQGITGLVIDDEGDFRDFLEHNHQYWDYVDEELMQEKQGLCRITFYLSDDPEGYHRLAQVRMALSQLKAAHPEYAPLLLTMNNLEDADWENNWKQFYKPMEIGERLIVVPEWEQANTQGRIPLILNPGLTFGTGSHATTRLCLTALEETIHGGERVLDLGCGSGILSIAALRLGAEHAFACDIDEKCVEVAYENAALNGIDLSRYTVRWGDVLSDQQLKAEIGGGYDMVVANIVADVIIGLSGQVRPFLKEDGLFLCSGIIDDRAEEVARHLREAGWDILRTRQSEGWFSYLCR